MLVFIYFEGVLLRLSFLNQENKIIVKKRLNEYLAEIKLYKKKETNFKIDSLFSSLVSFL